MQELLYQFDTTKIPVPLPALIVRSLWLIPGGAYGGVGVIALLKQPRRKLVCRIGNWRFVSFAAPLNHRVCARAQYQIASVALNFSPRVNETFNFTWFHFGTATVDLGWVLDPLAAVMLVMVCFVGLLIFIYSTGYMEHDVNFTRFFCFLSLFAGAMLGVVIANSILLLFMCWELVGLTSYLLIGFWYRNLRLLRREKALSSPRVGDIFFFLGIVWLFSQTGTLLFYNNGGAGSLESTQLAGCQWACRPGIEVPLSAFPIFCRRRARAANCPCTCGCRTPWKDLRRSPRSFMRPRWLPRACI